VVKSVVVPRIVAREDELDRLKALFAELGFSSGESWSDKKSSGLPMLAPMGALEFYHGQPPAAADVIVEVEDIARAIETVQRHGMRIVAETQRTHW
jgi:4-hydroxyphenylpyruvate dioxygenase-like putative hemolysin